MKKFYLAAKFSRIEEMRQLSDELRDVLGWTPSCRWVYGGEEGLSRANIALLDLEDVAACDVIILFTHPREEPQPGGGRFVEFGYAMALGKELMVVGPEENVFLSHPDVQLYPTYPDFLTYLDFMNVQKDAR